MINIVNILVSIMSLYHNITLAADILYFNKTAVLTSIRISIKFITL